MAREWYAKRLHSGGAAVIDEVTGQTMASVQELADAPLVAAAPRLLEALKTAELCIRHAVQEAEGRVRQEIRRGWEYDANEIRRLIYEVENP